MINIKTPEEIEIMAEGGKILGSILNEVVNITVPGKSTLELDEFTNTLITKNNALASFKTVREYQWATCICINDVVVHGIPKKDDIVKKGDIVGIDMGVLFKGYHTDISTSIIVGEPENNAHKKFLNTGIDALKEAIKVAKAGNYTYDISQRIQTIIEKEGYSIVHQLVGHGVGKKLHEDPQIPGFIQKGTIRERTDILKVGMTIAIEIIYTMGNGKVVYKNADGWTIATEDQSLAGLFEKTIAITENGPRLITPFEDRVL